MSQRLKEEFLRLLEEDMEFRYAVAGLIGLDEILKRLDKHDEKFNEILKRLDGHEEGLVKLREETARLWKEIARLREDMVKGFERHDTEMAKLREDMVEGFKRHDGILEKHSQEIARLREDFNKMLEVVRGLQEGHVRLERRLDSLESAMISGFGELSKFAGITFEDFVRKFLTTLLRRAREIPENAELKKAMIEGEEINLFLEDPLIVEVTAYAETVEEIRKLLRKFLVVLTISSEVAGKLRDIAEKENVELIIGKIPS